MWQRIMLQQAPVRVCPGIHQDGKGAKPLIKSYKDIRCVRKTYVLPEA